MLHSNEQDLVVEQARRIVRNTMGKDEMVKDLFDRIMMDDGITSYKKLPSDLQHIVNINPQQFKVFVTDNQEGILVRLARPPIIAEIHSKASRIRPAVMADLEWFSGAPCVTNLNGCVYLSGTPMHFLPPHSVIFGLRNGNDDSERVGAVNSVIQEYFQKEAKWTTFECQPGVPCIARCSEGDGIYSYVRAIVVSSSDDNCFECVCMDINATVNIDAEDIGPLPNCLSVKKLVPACFVGKIRSIAAMDELNQELLRELVSGYSSNSEDQVAKPLPAAVFGLHKGEYIVDWVDPNFKEWISLALLDSKRADPDNQDLPTPGVEDAVAYIEDMEHTGQFKFSGLEWNANDEPPAVVVEKSVVQPEACPPPTQEQQSPAVKDNDESVSSSFLDDNAPVDIDIDDASDRLKQCHVVNTSVHKDIQSTSAPVPRDSPADCDPAVQFCQVFKNLSGISKGIALDHLFVANSLAFASCARAAHSAGNWDDVITEIQKHL